MTSLGRWAVGLAVAFIVLLGVFVVLLATGLAGGTAFAFTPQLIAGLLALASGIAALVFGLIAIISQHERSLLAIGATLVGFLVTVIGFPLSLFVIGELAIPPFD